MADDGGMFWAIVKVNLVDPKSDTDEFNRWYDELHVPEFVGQEGFHRGWRVQVEPDPSQIGDPAQEFAAVYEIDTVASFKKALDLSPTAGHSWGDWEGRVSDWSRRFYRILARHEADGNKGRYWAIIRTDFTGGEAQERKFNEWYTREHMPGVCANSGFHRAWRLQAEPSPFQLGGEEFKYWAVYEVDRPEDMVAARDGKPAWNGLWQSQVVGWARSYHRLLFEMSKNTKGVTEQ